MRWVRRDDRGAVTAEFVIVLPAVLAVLALAVAAVLLATHRVALTSAAAEIARLEARGGDEAARQRLAGMGTGVSAARERNGPLHCVHLRFRPASGLLAIAEVSARGCAAVVDTAVGASDDPTTGSR
jgi:hypothetical protein